MKGGGLVMVLCTVVVAFLTELGCLSFVMTGCPNVTFGSLFAVAGRGEFQGGTGMADARKVLEGKTSIECLGRVPGRVRLVGGLFVVVFVFILFSITDDGFSLVQSRVMLTAAIFHRMAGSAASGCVDDQLAHG
jgi:hypothetical protein